VRASRGKPPSAAARSCRAHRSCSSARLRASRSRSGSVTHTKGILPALEALAERRPARQRFPGGARAEDALWFGRGRQAARASVRRVPYRPCPRREFRDREGPGGGGGGGRCSFAAVARRAGRNAALALVRDGPRSRGNLRDLRGRHPSPARLSPRVHRGPAARLQRGAGRDLRRRRPAFRPGGRSSLSRGRAFLGVRRRAVPPPRNGRIAHRAARPTSSPSSRARLGNPEAGLGFSASTDAVGRSFAGVAPAPHT